MATSMHLSKVRKWVASSPPVEWGMSHLRELLIGAARQGPMPQHVAFVMDGNRRFAKDQGIERVEGHNLGFEALAKILEVCYKSGVRVVTIYAFSIENFKRSKYEVDSLMEMAKVKLSQLSQHGDLLDRYGASVRVLGRRDPLRPDVLEAIDRAVELTSRNGDAILNICFPYTSRDEITSAIRNTVIDYSTPLDRSQLPITTNGSRHPFCESRIVQTIREQTPSADPIKIQQQHEKETADDNNNNNNKNNANNNANNLTTNDASYDSTSSYSSSATTIHQSQSACSSQTSAAIVPEPYTSYPPNSGQLLFHSAETITAQTLDDHMFTAGNPPLDILIRTSGVERLSDFMLWQCHQDTQIVFLDTLWPAFSLWEFMPVIWDWQRRVRKQNSRRDPEFEFPSDYSSGGEDKRGWSSEEEEVKLKES